MLLLLIAKKKKRTKLAKWGVELVGSLSPGPTTITTTTITTRRSTSLVNYLKPREDTNKAKIKKINPFVFFLFYLSLSTYSLLFSFGFVIRLRRLCVSVPLLSLSFLLKSFVWFWRVGRLCWWGLCSCTFGKIEEREAKRIECCCWYYYNNKLELRLPRLQNGLWSRVW